MSDTEPRQILSVTELNLRSRELLEAALPSVWVEGEVSNLATPSSGHWYFTLKDDSAQIRCAMFRNRNLAYLRRRPQNGQQLLVLGGVSLYTARGDYQLIIEHIEDAGEGRLKRDLEKLKAKLAELGWFDEATKRPVPKIPAHIAVITSPTGAAIHDFLTVIGQRHPPTRISILPTPVQGETATGSLCSALELINREGPKLDPPVDVLVVTRGGGSLEDLWAFNTETVAAAIHSSRIPVVSAVGHEIDFTIADLVADLRAATPSAAAALLSPEADQLLESVKIVREKLLRSLRRRLEHHRLLVDTLQRRLRHPAATLRDRAQALDEIDQRVQRAIALCILRSQQRTASVRFRFAAQQPARRVQRERNTLQVLTGRHERAMQSILQRARRQLGANAQLLEAVSPMATLARGYAIVQDANGGIVRNTEQVGIGDPVVARLALGELGCRVETVYPTRKPE